MRRDPELLTIVTARGQARAFFLAVSSEKTKAVKHMHAPRLCGRQSKSHIWQKKFLKMLKSCAVALNHIEQNEKRNDLMEFISKTEAERQLETTQPGHERKRRVGRP